MKKAFLLLFLAVLFATVNIFAQEQKPDYSRSSLTFIQIDSDSDTLTLSEDKAMIQDFFRWWTDKRFPVKYDNNNVDTRLITESYYSNLDVDFSNLTPEKQAKLHKLDSMSHTGKELLDSLNAMNYNRLYNKYKEQLQFWKALDEKQIARQIVAKWFGYTGEKQADGSMFNMDLVQERGLHNASELDKQKAAGATRSVEAQLKDNGEILLNNSYVLTNWLSFYKNEPIARMVCDAAIAAASMLPMGQELAIQAAEAIYLATKDGYSCNSKTNLFKLVWNDTIANELYAHWMYNEENKKWFETTDIFKLKYLDNQSNFATVAFSAGKTKKRVLTQLGERSMNNIMQKLQKQNEQFRPICPLIQPVDAKYMLVDAGMKEGLSGGEKFEKIEMIQDEEGRYSYKKTGVLLTVDKKLVYNNLFDSKLTYNFNPDEFVIDTIRDKKGNVTETKKRYSLEGVNPKATSEDDKTFIDVENIADNDVDAKTLKANAKVLASVAKTMEAASMQYDPSVVLRYTDPDQKNTFVYFVKVNGQWIQVPQTAPDGSILKGTIVKGAKLPAGTLLRQSTFKKTK